jgi:hypothetical protein
MTATLHQGPAALPAAPKEKLIPLVELTSGLSESAADAIRAAHAVIQFSGDLARVIDQHFSEISKSRTVLIDAGCLSFSEADRSAIVRLASMGVRIILVAPQPERGFAPMLVLHETEMARALVASLYTLSHGQKLVVMTAPSPDRNALRGLVRHALRWRASLQDPEEGDFSSSPI